MKQDLQSHLKWIHSQSESMLAMLIKWANINSGSNNLSGLAQMLLQVQNSFSVLEGEMREVILPARQTIDSHGNVKIFSHGNALQITKHIHAPIKVFLGGHIDTVYSTEDPFQQVEKKR